MFAWLALDSQISACLCLSGILEDASHHAQLIDFKDATTHFLWFHQHVSSVKSHSSRIFPESAGDCVLISPSNTDGNAPV